MSAAGTVLETYDTLWQRFVADGRVEPGGHTLETWRRGRDTFAAFVVRVIDGSLFRRVDRIRFALRSHPFVSTHPDHFLHLTVVPIGFVVEQPGAADELSPDTLAAIGAAGAERLRRFRPTTVDLANVNSFSTAAFVEVRNPDDILAIQEALGDAMRAVGRDLAATRLERPTSVPHVSLAYYTEPADNADLVETLAWFRGRPIGRVAVRSVQLATIDTSFAYPPVVTLRDLPLGEGARPSVNGRLER